MSIDLCFAEAVQNLRLLKKSGLDGDLISNICI